MRYFLCNNCLFGYPFINYKIFSWNMNWIKSVKPEHDQIAVKIIFYLLIYGFYKLNLQTLPQKFQQ